MADDPDGRFDAMFAKITRIAEAEGRLPPVTDDPEGRFAAIYTEVARIGQLRTARNRQAQRVYRQRHGDDLRKARRIVTALLSMRRFRRPRGWGAHSPKTVAKALRGFLTTQEMRELRNAMWRWR